MAIYIVRDKYDIPLKKIGEHFGNRDHATILHSISKMEEFMKDDPDVKQDVENICKKVHFGFRYFLKGSDNNG